jgi:hypothetical protein
VPFLCFLVSQNGLLLKHINPSIVDSVQCLVLNAVKQNGLALQYAKTWSSHNDIALSACKENYQARSFVSADVLFDQKTASRISDMRRVYYFNEANKLPHRSCTYEIESKAEIKNELLEEVAGDESKYKNTSCLKFAGEKSAGKNDSILEAVDEKGTSESDSRSEVNGEQSNGESDCSSDFAEKKLRERHYLFSRKTYAYLSPRLDKAKRFLTHAHKRLVKRKVGSAGTAVGLALKIVAKAARLCVHMHTSQFERIKLKRSQASALSSECGEA